MLQGSRVVWRSGVACNAMAALLQSLRTLTVKLTDGCVPVFKLVVKLFMLAYSKVLRIDSYL